MLSALVTIPKQIRCADDVPVIRAANVSPFLRRAGARTSHAYSRDAVLSVQKHFCVPAKSIVTQKGNTHQALRDETCVTRLKYYNRNKASVVRLASVVWEIMKMDVVYFPTAVGCPLGRSLNCLAILERRSIMIHNSALA